MTWVTAELCPVCLQHEAYWDDQRESVEAICPRCGSFTFTDDARLALEDEADVSHCSGELRLGPTASRKRTNASAWIRGNQGVALGSEDVNRLAQVQAPTIPERATKLLLSLMNESQSAGQEININTPDWQARVWAQDRNEATALAEFLEEDGLVKIGQQTLGPAGSVPVRITARGWERLEQLHGATRQPTEIVNGYADSRVDESASAVSGDPPSPFRSEPRAQTCAGRVVRGQGSTTVQEESMKKNVRFFVSYARANQDLAGKFMEKLGEQLQPSARYKYETWKDSNVLVGEDWHEEIQAALGKCDLGLLLVSPAFLSSQYIEEHELPTFVGKSAKPVIPVLLQPVDFDRHDLKGLKRKQLFRLETGRHNKAKAFGECPTALAREKFAQELFRQIEEVLDKYFERT